MNRKTWLRVGVVCVVAVACIYLRMNQFRPKTIGIYHTARPSGYAMTTRRKEPPRLTFGLEGRFQLTEIEVVPLAEWQTNHLALPAWHLVSESGSDPVSRFSYGQHIRGMEPAVAGAQPQPLQPDVTYRLFVTAGRMKGQHDFEIK